MRLYKSMKKSTKGLALIELIIALGILGAITAAVVTLASRSIQANNLNTLIRNVTDLTIGMKQTFRGNYDVTPATADTEIQTVLKNAGIPEGAFSNPLGEPYKFGIASVRGIDKRAGMVEIKDLRKEDCVTLAQQMYDGVDYMKITDGTGNFDADIEIPKAVVADGYLKSLYGTLDYSIVNISTACGARVDGNSLILGIR